jgi:hypothetical protein
MRGRTLALAALSIGLAGGAYFAWMHRSPAPEQQWALLDEYCVGCHNATELAGDVAFDTLTPDAIHENAAIWEAAIVKLRGHLMPPPGEPRPDDARIVSFVTWLEATLDRAALAAPNPGAPALHRLNRVEYANAIRDLLDIKVDPATLLPGDDSSEGFDNIANALAVSPALLAAYVTAAGKISRLAVGDPGASPGITTYRAPRGLDQGLHLDGQPFGTRGGIFVRHVFPLDADYEIRVARANGGFGLETVGGDEEIELTLNGERVSLIGRGAPRGLVLSIPAGPQVLGAAIVRKRNAQGVDDLHSVHAASPGVQNLAIIGPLNARSLGDTPSRRKIFVCTPSAADEERACAEAILRNLAGKAFRRPVEVSDRSLTTLLAFYEEGRAQRDFDAGIQAGLARVLVDPEFIYRFEQEPEGLPDGAVYRLSDFEIASRLSFFLWSSIPDDELMRAAAAGELSNSALLEAQVRRMLADSRADALVENFAGQWLMLRQLDTVSPATTEFDGNLRAAMRRETQLLFESILREDRSITELLSADYTFVDERLARHYGIPNIRGSRFRRVALPDESRRGLLGHGSILTVTSAPNRTSPVKRGQWVLENLLGTPVPPPPDNVETNLDETAAVTAGSSSMRERLERHMQEPGCAACHNIMDPIGFALENFDLIGKWRDAEAGAPIDAAGRLIDGTEIDGPAALRHALLEHREMFAMTATRKLLTYALGRSVEHYDMPVVRGIVREAAADDYRFSALVLGIAASVPFQMKVKEPAPPAQQASAR